MPSVALLKGILQISNKGSVIRRALVDLNFPFSVFFKKIPPMTSVMSLRCLGFGSRFKSYFLEIGSLDFF